MLEFAESVIDCIRVGYVEGNEEHKSDLLHLAEQVLQYAILLEDMIPEGESFVACIRELVSLITVKQEGSSVTKRGRPEVLIEEDQLTFLTEQGFKMAVMFGCCRRTIERPLTSLELVVTISLLLMMDNWMKLCRRFVYYSLQHLNITAISLILNP